MLSTYVIVSISVGAILLLLLILAVSYFCYRCCTRYDYTPLLEDMSLPSKWRREREADRNTVREEALMNCQYYLRSHGGKYTYMDYLPNMGTRLEKHWFLVRRERMTKDLIMNVWKKNNNCPVPFDCSTQKTLKELLRAISHPYVWPVLDVDLWADQSLIITVQSYKKGGSLKDHIYGVKPNYYVEDKYGCSGRPLPAKQLKLYGLQILQGLIYLGEQGFPYHGNICSGNVILEKRMCRLAGYENPFFGCMTQLAPVLEKHSKDDMQALDSLLFGHMMYEMSAGEELTQALPDRLQLQKCHAPGVKELLEFIFDVNMDYPSIRNVAEHPFFVGVQLSQLEKEAPHQVQVTPAMKTIFKSVKKGRRIRTKRKSSSSSKSKRTPTSYGTVGSSSPSTGSSSLHVQSTPVNRTAVQPPSSPAPPPPPPPRASGDHGRLDPVPEKTNDRNALLSQIRQGRKLNRIKDPKV